MAHSICCIRCSSGEMAREILLHTLRPLMNISVMILVCIIKHY
jgi:hypothetical protein